MPTFFESLEKGQPVTKPMQNSLADSIAMPYVGVNAFYNALPLIDRMVRFRTTTSIRDINVLFIRCSYNYFIKKIITDIAKRRLDRSCYFVYCRKRAFRDRRRRRLRCGSNSKQPCSRIED